MGKSASAPPAPDYRGAAVAQGAANQESARTSGRMSNPNVYNPLGSRTVQFGEDDSVTVNESLSPQGQSLFDQQMRISQALGNTGEAGLSRVDQSMATPFSLAGAPAMPKAPEVGSIGAKDQTRVGDALYRQATRYVQPQLDRRQTQLDTQLVNQGLRRGTEAWNNAQFDMEGERNRTLGDISDRAVLASGQEQARLFGLDAGADSHRFGQEAQAFSLGGDARARGIQEQILQRQMPLNELNSLRTGASPGMPQFQAYTGQNVAPPNMVNALGQQGQWDQNIYNQQMGQQNAGISTAGSMAAMGAMYFM